MLPMTIVNQQQSYLFSLADLALQLWLHGVKFQTCSFNGSISSHTGFQSEPVGSCHLSLCRLQLHLQPMHLLLQLLALQICPCPVL